MNLLLNLASLVVLAIHLPTLLWMLLRGQDLTPGLSRAFGLVPRRLGHGPCIWFHAASMGELQVLTALLPNLEKQFPQWDIIVSTGSWSGWDMAQRQLSRYHLVMAPWDLPFAVRRALDRIRPQVVAVIEFAPHPNLIAAASARGITLTLLNGRISRQHERFCRRWPGAARPMLAAFDSILVQSPADIGSFRAKGVDANRLAVGGALKFDCACRQRANPESHKLAQLAGIAPGDVVFLAGSTRRGEDEIVARVFRQLAVESPQLKLIVTPRNARRFGDATRSLQRLGLRPVRRTSLGRRPNDAPPRVIVVDTLGELPAWWGVADIGFVGNSLTHRGGQNMIEPAAFGVATCFGPLTDNFQDVADLLLAEDAAVVVNDEEELTAFVRRCIVDPEYAARLGSRAQAVVGAQAGGQMRTLAHLGALLTSGPEKRTLPARPTLPGLLPQRNAA